MVAFFLEECMLLQDLPKFSSGHAAGNSISELGFARQTERISRGKSPDCMNQGFAPLHCSAGAVGR